MPGLLGGYCETDAERAAMEQYDYDQWRAKEDADEFCRMKAREAAFAELLSEWVVWYAAQRHIGPTTAWAIVRGEADWPNAPPSDQSLPARTISLLAQK